ncbi:hypothetical protein GS875_25940 [Rhodococcus hoagii]|nr:hypothetical protein [Prescottella equi]
MARPGGREAEDFAALSSSRAGLVRAGAVGGRAALVQLPEHERGAPDCQDHRPFDESDGAGRGHRQHRGGCGVAAPLEAAAGAAGDASDGTADTADEASTAAPPSAPMDDVVTSAMPETARTAPPVKDIDPLPDP